MIFFFVFLDFFTEHLFTSRGHTRTIVWKTLLCDHLLKSSPVGESLYHCRTSECGRVDFLGQEVITFHRMTHRCIHNLQSWLYAAAVRFVLLKVVAAFDALHVTWSLLLQGELIVATALTDVMWFEQPGAFNSDYSKGFGWGSGPRWGQIEHLRDKRPTLEYVDEHLLPFPCAVKRSLSSQKNL